MLKPLIFAGTICLLASCVESTTSNTTTGVTFDNDTVTVSLQSPVRTKIKLYKVETTDFSSDFHTTGVVKPANGQIAEIAPLFDGRVTRSFIRLGQRVSAGTPLFELYSAEFSEAVKNYYQSLHTKKQAEQNLQRQRDLVANGVGTARELEEAETEYEVAAADHENSVTALRILNIDPSKIGMGQALTVVSPIAGVVIQTNITIGQYLKSEDGPLAIIAELGKVWVVAQVKERHIGSIHTEDCVEVTTDAYPDELVTGKILHIGELLDEETRSVQVLVECDNSNRHLKPGMFAGVRFTSAPRKSIVIPSTAVLQNEDEAYVYVETGRDQYVRRSIKAATANAHESLVTEGLESGDVIVSQGAIYLMGN